MGEPASLTIGLALSFLLIMNILLLKASNHRMISYMLHCPDVSFPPNFDALFYINSSNLLDSKTSHQLRVLLKTLLKFHLPHNSPAMIFFQIEVSLHQLLK
jgi:hypothetical protein